MKMRLPWTIAATVMCWLLCANGVQAKSKKTQLPEEFPPSPLEMIVPDPLLPGKLPLTQLNPSEKQALEVALEQLNQQAAAKLSAGDETGAFDTWNRELRLRRYLGSLSEVQALGRVGAIAYNRNNRFEVQYITQRLQAIDKSNQISDVQLLQALGQAYEAVRSPAPALIVYNRLLTLVRQRGNTANEIEILKTIGGVHLSWFDYQKAATVYEELLNLTTVTGDRLGQVEYLTELAYIYDKAKQPRKAINIRTQLADIYRNTSNFVQIPELQLAIGSDYQTLATEDPSLIQQAFTNYQNAYTSAWELQQYIRAGEALQKLIALYRSQGQIPAALQTSQILIQTEQQAANYYGLMNAYDQIGQMHLQLQQYPQALAAFQKGLQLAQQLNYDPDYFTQQIQKSSKRYF